MPDILSESPELTRRAIAQAEAEARREAESHDELERVIEPATVAGRPAPPLSFARRLLIGKAVGGEDTTDEIALFVCVFVLFGGGVAELSRRVRNRERFVEDAIAFADTVPAEQYEEMARYAARKMAHLAQATAGEAQGESEGGPAGNALA